VRRLIRIGTARGVRPQPGISQAACRRRRDGIGFARRFREETPKAARNLADGPRSRDADAAYLVPKLEKDDIVIDAETPITLTIFAARKS